MIIKKIALLLGTAFLLTGCGIPEVKQEEYFADPVQYEEPVAELYKEPLYAEDEGGEYDVKKLTIHYYNPDKRSNTREIYTWTNGIDNSYHSLVPDEDDTEGLFYHVTLDYTDADKMYAGKSFLNFIVKYVGTWDGQSQDCELNFEEFPPDESGEVTVWTCPDNGGTVSIYATKAETQMARVSQAYFTDWKTIHCIADEKPKLFRLYAYDKAYLVSSDAVKARTQPLRLIKTGNPSGAEFDIKFNYTAHINVQYVVETEYDSHVKVQSIIATAFKLYEDPNFVKYYNYSGDDLGCTYTPSKTTFKVWAPTAGAVLLNVYNKGTPKKVGIKGASNIHETYFMTMQPGGVWEKTLLTPNDGDKIEGKYYTYTIYNSEGVSEVVDPYAHTTGVNGLRGMICDFSKTNPDDWDKLPLKWDGDSTYDIDSPQRLSIYEVHIRDLTEDKTWGGKEANGTFKAFAEKGTKYKTVSTGFDHIEEMGVTAVQIMPVFDHDNNELFYYNVEEGGEVTDEQVYVPRSYDGEYKDKLKLEYNWGYNPLNYNVVEGSYSSDPEDGAVRVKEFKELIYAYANNKNHTRITMDVVYNHVSSVSNSNFTKIMPRYYFRFNEAADEYWNGSGCSNEVKTEAPMMRKFIVDSLCWWASEYKIKGFRFDLMELIDMETLNEARAALYKIDPDIYMYGEGWKAADSGLKSAGGSRENVYKLGGAKAGSIYLGGFNDGGRDGLKGGNDGGSTGKSNFTWVGTEEGTKGAGKTTYGLSVGGWAAANAEVFVHAWKNDKDYKDYKITDPTKIDIYDGYNNLLLVRMPPNSQSLSWDNNWGQSTDMTVGKGTLTFKDWGTIRTPGAGFISKDMTGDESHRVGNMLVGRNSNYGGAQDPKQTVNYASCHDNFTLYDQLSWGLAEGSYGSIDDASKAPAISQVMTAVASCEIAVAMSNGVAFVLGGDELLRTKVEDNPAKSREGEDYVKMYGTLISHNSYKSSPQCNSFKWDRKITVTGYKGAPIPNTACKQIAKAFEARNKITKFSDVTSGDTCNYWDAGDGSKQIGFYMGGYVTLLSGRRDNTFGWPSNGKSVVTSTGNVYQGDTTTVNAYSVGVFRA